MGVSPATELQRPPVSHLWSDPAALVVVYLALLIALPARLVFDPLGAVGRPALLLGLVAAYWWSSSRLVPALGTGNSGFQPVHWILLPYAMFMVLGYAVAHTRALTDLEVSSANRALITLASLCGMALLTADGIVSRERLNLVLGAVVAGGAAMATVGIVQFTTGWDPVPLIRVPGLRYDPGFEGIPTRSLFNRPYGTALHPIEFGVVCAAVLPLAIHYGIHGATKRARSWSWTTTLALALAVPMSLSRSGILALVVAMIYLAAGWQWRQRLTAFAYSIAFTLLMSVTIPGLLGTIRSLFTNTETDPSIVSRRERVPRVLDLIAERPWLGRGHGTYSPDDYFLLDNQYYKTAIESGVLGVVVIVMTLFVGGICIARGARRRARTEVSHDLGQALAAPIAGFAVATYTFDAFFYPAFTGILFLLIGAAGALWRIEEADPRPRYLPRPTSTSDTHSTGHHL